MHATNSPRKNAKTLWPNGVRISVLAAPTALRPIAANDPPHAALLASATWFFEYLSTRVFRSWFGPSRRARRGWCQKVPKSAKKCKKVPDNPSLDPFGRALVTLNRGRGLLLRSRLVPRADEETQSLFGCGAAALCLGVK